MITLFFIFYLIPLFIIVLYNIERLLLVCLYWRKHWQKKELLPPPLPAPPAVTLQLPIYNERYVVEQLLEAVGNIDYPKEQLIIQILDDSTDETTDIIARCVTKLQARGFSVQHVRRNNREGFKAGALAHGLTLTDSPFVAIFDADFLPNPDFLWQTLPVFSQDEHIGAVQARWEHLNNNYSLLTRIQEIILDAHFIMEQWGRNRAGHFINFNGTAGIWRRTCIVEAGGWHADTLTEDLDLSYRAQLRGWQIAFLPNVTVPAELPVAMQAVKSQQFRWIKGGAECARKHILNVWRTPNIPLITRLQATFHLFSSSVFICVLLISLLHLPLMLWQQNHPELTALFQFLSYLSWSILAVLLFFATAYWHLCLQRRRSFWSFFLYFPAFLCVSMGFSLHNGLAAIEGLIGKKTPFIRTPKFGVQKSANHWQQNKYIMPKISIGTYFEAFLSLYFFAAIVVCMVLSVWNALPFFALLFVGYSLLAGYSWQHAKQAQ